MMESIGLWPSLIAIVVLYWTWTAVYRLWLSPIAHFPGPKLAALTSWYEFYYDIILPAQFPFHLRKLHAQYGPVVRITPDELSVSDPHFYATLYAGPGKRRDKWKPVPGQKWVRDSVAGSMPHETHRMRRAALNPAFSTPRVAAREQLYQEKINIFMQRLEGFKVTGERVSAWRVLAALMNDCIMEFCLGYCNNRLQQTSFREDEEVDEILQNIVGGHRMKQFGRLPRLIEAFLFELPTNLLVKILPPFRKFLEEQNSIAEQVRSIAAAAASSPPPPTQPITLPTELFASKLPDSEKGPSRIAQETGTVLAAGTHGTSFAMATCIYYLLASPTALKRLKRELAEAMPLVPSEQRSSNTGTEAVMMPKALSWKEAERLPYLRGCIQEALRLSYGASARLPRISPVETLTLRVDDDRQNDGNGMDAKGGGGGEKARLTAGPVKEWRIPPGTPIGMSAMLVHHDEKIFPNSYAFVPERWMQGGNLDRYMVSFTKGSRSCVGMNLAYALMYLTLARLFRVYGSKECREVGDVGYLDLDGTTLEDVEPAFDGFIPLSKNGSHGLRFVVKQYE